MNHVYRKPHLLILTSALLVMLLITFFTTGSAFAMSRPPKQRSIHPATVAVGMQPYSVVMGDFNGDGKLDMAVANAENNAVGILLGRGDGTFAPQVTYAVGRYPKAIAVGDFNGDGKLDLAVANNSDSTISILSGKGDGTFAPQVTYAVGSFPTSIAVGDFNGDGKLDLAVANSGSGTVSILLGNGDGTFAPQVTYTVGNYPLAVVTGDFNRDGKLDLVTANSNGMVSVFLGNGDGTFAAPVTYAAGNGATSVAVGDFNHDGKLDLVIANDADNTVSILLGNGDGTFAAQVTYPVGQHPSSVAVADLNSDGKLDLVIANSSDNTIGVLLGNGDGTFAAQVTYPVGQGPAAVAIGDLNNDGKLDLAVANSLDGTVTILLGNGDGTFTSNTVHITTQNISETAGDSFTENLVTISGFQSSNVTATINWNDDTSPTAGTVSGSDPYTISGTHTYSKAGTYNIIVTITDSGTGQSVEAYPVATVTANAIFLTTQLANGATEGSAFTGVVATGSVSGNVTVSSLTAFITWGDGNTSTGTVTSTGQTTFNVSGTHTYAEEGRDAISVTVIDNNNHSATVTDPPAVVNDAPLTFTSFRVSPGTLSASLSAAFTDADPNGTLTDYTASVNWGDGNSGTLTTVKGKLTFNVIGKHTYAQAGKYTVTLTVTDSGSSLITKNVTITVK